MMIEEIFFLKVERGNLLFDAYMEKVDIKAAGSNMA